MVFLRKRVDSRQRGRSMNGHYNYASVLAPPILISPACWRRKAICPEPWNSCAEPRKAQTQALRGKQQKPYGICHSPHVDDPSISFQFHQRRLSRGSLQLAAGGVDIQAAGLS